MSTEDEFKNGVIGVMDARHNENYESFSSNLKDPAYKPTIPEVLPLVKALYASENGYAGCCLHIILDDGNIRNDNGFCIEWAKNAGHKNCELLAILLSRMSFSQRRRLIRMNY